VLSACQTGLGSMRGTEGTSACSAHSLPRVRVPCS
jgi:hypothetical protein